MEDVQLHSSSLEPRNAFPQRSSKLKTERSFLHNVPADPGSVHAEDTRGCKFYFIHTPLREHHFNTLAFALLAILPGPLPLACQACDSVILLIYANEDLILSDLFNLETKWLN